jgi:hypothetical protein
MYILKNNICILFKYLAFHSYIYLMFVNTLIVNIIYRDIDYL